MPKTAEEQLTWEHQCYGCTASALEDILEHGTMMAMREPIQVAFSMLSNAQEEIDLGMKNEARQTINRAKWMINKHTETKGCTG